MLGRISFVFGGAVSFLTFPLCFCCLYGSLGSCASKYFRPLRPRMRATIAQIFEGMGPNMGGIGRTLLSILFVNFVGGATCIAHLYDASRDKRGQEGEGGPLL